MNQQEFWGRIGVTQSGGSRYESGRNMPKPVQELLRVGIGGREERWSQSLAVGGQAYLDQIKAALGGRASHRHITEANEAVELSVSEEPRYPS